MLVASLFMLMQFVDLGTGAVVVNAFSEPGNTPELRANVAARVVRVLVASSTAVAVVGWLGTFAWSWSEILGVTGDTRTTDLATAVSITVFALSIPPSIGTRLLVGCGRADLSILIAPLGSVASLATGWLLLQTSLDSIWISVSMPGGVLVSQIISLILGIRVSRLKVRDLFRASTFPVRDVLSSSIPMLVIMVTLPFALQSHRIIISHLSTPIELARYSLAMQFYQPLWSFIGAAATPLWPQWSALRGDTAAVSTAFRRGTLALVVLGTGALVGLVFLGDIVAGVMTAHTIVVGLPLLAATGVLLTVQAVQQAPGMYLTTARGRYSSCRSWA
jgi:O-antigen/teichoic acid export membrane protein